MKKMAIGFERCNDCPAFFTVRNPASIGSWDKLADCFCGKLEKYIEEAVPWDKDIEIPEECPLEDA